MFSMAGYVGLGYLVFVNPLSQLALKFVYHFQEAEARPSHFGLLPPILPLLLHPVLPTPL